MPKITRVDALDNNTLDIELDNSSLILFNVTHLIETDAAFSALRMEGTIPRPSTDGRSIFWHGCPKLTLKKILEDVGM